MNKKQKNAWDAIKDWLEKFNNDERPWETTPAADLLTLIWEAEKDESIIHASPEGDSGLTPCCNQSVYELPFNHRITLDKKLVTCGKPAPVDINEMW